MRYTSVGYIIVSILFGLYIGASGIAIYFMIQNGLRRRPRQIALFIQLCLYTITIINFLTQCAAGPLFLQMILIQSNNGHSMEERVVAYNTAKGPHRIGYINSFSGNLSLMAADILVFWRAWAMWHGNKFVQWILIVFATSNAVLIILSTTVGPLDEPGESFGSVFESDLFLFFSLISNILATSAIAYKAWTANIFSKEYAKYQSDRTRAQKVLLFIVESGVLFCILQVVYYAITITVDLEAKSVTTSYLPSYFIIQAVAVMIVPFYPTILFIVSHLIWDSE
ncbi:hypothetical protein GYMLUDRAFT_781107 [Collybiopsis luxurians FD-317 M1]|uniref:Uncharacterized protein n=1 Tax=Collybiopsis luxurians FD-317 M1 TaxID=944289 RepID=A0A0D0BNT5_9AGAR|nr:hypothetical protein GYMLUDRAFT_781107 [Collybiopsis luxurians FD-317 M1]